MPVNFFVYKAAQLRKINSQRRALSEAEFVDVPVLTKGDVQYIPEARMGGEPATCYNCTFYNEGRSCGLMGKGVTIKKFTYPPAPTSDAKPIEYWPCCSAWFKGKPNYGPESFKDELATPDELGLGWINAPRPGQEYGGANCGGKDGGDDCDHYITKGPDKRAECSAFCRVLQQNVENGAVCSAWRDDDFIPWQRAQDLLREVGKHGR